MTKRTVNGVLLLFHHFPGENAPAIMQHVGAFERHSRHSVFPVNTDRGFPRGLRSLEFRAIVLHYSLFGGDCYFINRRYQHLLQRHRDAPKVAFFQDEYRYCVKRFEFLDRYGVDAVYTLLEPEQHAAVYGLHTGVSTIRTTLTGYVSDEMVERAAILAKPDEKRSIDVGYRARRLPFWMGRGAQEKHGIADHFLAHAEGLGLTVDIDSREERRIYGDAWYDFVADCRGMLGVEAGTSVFDLDDSARTRVDALLAAEPDLDFEEVVTRVLHEYEDRIPYRTVSPRHFEAAAFRVVQILFPGHYSGVMERDVHYLVLEKDFSNFDAVMARLSDPTERRRITDRAYDDLIASGRWSYAAFVHDFDEHLAELGVGDTLTSDEQQAISRRLRRGAKLGRVIAHPRWFLRNLSFPGREIVANRYRRIRRASDARA